MLRNFFCCRSFMFVMISRAHYILLVWLVLLMLSRMEEKLNEVFCECFRHRWTGRYEAHLWDKNCWNESQNKKGRQGFHFLAWILSLHKDILMFLLRSVCSNFIDNSFAFCFGFLFLVVFSLAINSTQMQSISVSKFISCIFLTWK